MEESEGIFTGGLGFDVVDLDGRGIDNLLVQREHGAAHGSPDGILTPFEGTSALEFSATEVPVAPDADVDPERRGTEGARRR